MLRSVAGLLFPRVNTINTIIGLLGDHQCKLLEGSAELTLEENKLLFDMVFNYIDETVVDITKSPHKTNLLLSTKKHCL